VIRRVESCSVWWDVNGTSYGASMGIPGHSIPGEPTRDIVFRLKQLSEPNSIAPNSVPSSVYTFLV
jgi:hypothetical protein